jgi:hypothetical protein
MLSEFHIYHGAKGYEVGMNGKLFAELALYALAQGYDLWYVAIYCHCSTKINHYLCFHKFCYGE